MLDKYIRHMSSLLRAKVVLNRLVKMIAASRKTHVGPLRNQQYGAFNLAAKYKISASSRRLQTSAGTLRNTCGSFKNRII
jgi:hypothetical protein